VVIETYTNKRLNFEIFAIYDQKLCWFVEKELKLSAKSAQIGWGDHRNPVNFQYSMTLNDIIKDETEFYKGSEEDEKEAKSNKYSIDYDPDFDYDLIIDIDIDKDNYAELILYSKTIWFG
jgi:hypothetical protein